MISGEDIKKYFWYLFGIMGVVFFWSGTWDGLGNLGPLVNPLVSLVVGVVLLSLSGIIFKDANVSLKGIREKGEEFWPYVVEPTVGLERLMLACLIEAYTETEARSGEEDAVHEKEVTLKLPKSHT